MCVCHEWTWTNGKEAWVKPMRARQTADRRHHHHTHLRDVMATPFARGENAFRRVVVVRARRQTRESRRFIYVERHIRARPESRAAPMRRHMQVSRVLTQSAVGAMELSQCIWMCDMVIDCRPIYILNFLLFYFAFSAFLCMPANQPIGEDKKKLLDLCSCC